MHGRFFTSLSRGSVRCHRASKFERLIEIIYQPRRAVAPVAEVDAILAGQASKGHAEGPKFGMDKLESRHSVGHWRAGLLPASGIA